ncbi:hypothetical protein BOSEA31B_12948 [Hyphomicrobiales bacterium]|nr:hypothetical protein BOSEA31B_12948 [Hyphomicrobiales bacterium]CAH1698721.1 hypothetical protein BOSEA1005_11774 [Hyphomicrobiales bacterium]CAI0342369.1 hypothetical protein BO1005MUT1_180148 [Hyphomicrobiales bacterium]
MQPFGIKPSDLAPVDSESERPAVFIFNKLEPVFFHGLRDGPVRLGRCRSPVPGMHTAG